MSQRDTTLLWLKDILEHLTASQERLEWTHDPETTRVLTEAMIRDLVRRDHRFRGVFLTRNFGHQAALRAGGLGRRGSPAIQAGDQKDRATHDTRAGNATHHGEYSLLMRRGRRYGPQT
jgi:hypothetical protein